MNVSLEVIVRDISNVLLPFYFFLHLRSKFYENGFYGNHNDVTDILYLNYYKIRKYIVSTIVLRLILKKRPKIVPSNPNQRYNKLQPKCFCVKISPLKENHGCSCKKFV